MSGNVDTSQLPDVWTFIHDKFEAVATKANVKNFRTRDTIHTGILFALIHFLESEEEDDEDTNRGSQQSEKKRSLTMFDTFLGLVRAHQGNQLKRIKDMITIGSFTCLDHNHMDRLIEFQGSLRRHRNADYWLPPYSKVQYGTNCQDLPYKGDRRIERIHGYFSSECERAMGVHASEATIFMRVSTAPSVLRRGTTSNLNPAFPYNVGPIKNVIEYIKFLAAQLDIKMHELIKLHFMLFGNLSTLEDYYNNYETRFTLVKNDDENAEAPQWPHTPFTSDWRLMTMLASFDPSCSNMEPNDDYGHLLPFSSLMRLVRTAIMSTALEMVNYNTTYSLNTYNTCALFHYLNQLSQYNSFPYPHCLQHSNTSTYLNTIMISTATGY